MKDKSKTQISSIKELENFKNPEHVESEGLKTGRGNKDTVEKSI